MDDRLVMGLVVAVAVVCVIVFLTGCDVHQNDLNIGLDVECEGKCRVVFEGKEAESRKETRGPTVPMMP